MKINGETFQPKETILPHWLIQQLDPKEAPKPICKIGFLDHHPDTSKINIRKEVFHEYPCSISSSDHCLLISTNHPLTLNVPEDTYFGCLALMDEDYKPYLYTILSLTLTKESSLTIQMPLSIHFR